MMLVLVMFLMFASIGLLSYAVVPVAVTQAGEINRKRSQKFVRSMDRILQEDDIQKAYKLYVFAPVLLAIAGLIFFPESFRLAGLVVGIILGFVLPRFWIQHLIQERKKKFKDQLMDALMIMSSSFRGGLSLIQTFEAVADEMPDPIRQEFGIVLGENKMGVGLEETMNRLYKRMPSSALQQMITAILLARETGGNLPAIFSRIISSMRERKKIEQNLQTLTVQGKIQAAVMTLLPILFIFGVSSSNPTFFDPMLHTPMGNKAIMLCIVLWVLGALSVWKISQFTDF